jgi:NAD kinase
MEIRKIIGLKIVAIKSIRTDRRKKRGFTPDFILFDDGATFIELDDQDYITYHDCSYTAKHINVYQDSDRWERMMNETEWFVDSDMDIGWD